MAGGLASRGWVEAAGWPQTNQITDDKDKAFGIWNDVFFDTVDIHHRTRSRNKYGPVIFLMNVECLLHLPAGSTVLITRMNPSKWENTQTQAQRYLLTPAVLAQDLIPGDFGQMLVISSPTKIVPFGQFLERIILDDPHAPSIQGSPEYQNAMSHLVHDAANNNIRVEVARRQCREECKCVAEYAEKATRINYFYKVQ
jgi:hypothetical protein